MFLTICVLFIIFPLLPLLPSAHWSIRFFDFVRVQTSVIQVLLIISSFIIWDAFSYQYISIIAFLSIVLLYQLWLILPYTPLFPEHKPKQQFHKKQLTIITANVLQTNKGFQDFIDLIEKELPDILITMESNDAWDQSTSKAFPEYKYTVKASLDNFYGMHLYSKIPLETGVVKYLVEKDIPSIHCEIQFASQRFNLIIIHPAPPSPTENETSKERDAELMLVGKICRSSVDATIVCGDLNDVVWSKTTRLFSKMTGYKNPRMGRGLFSSFHTKYWLLRYPLDHLFYSKDLYVTEIKRLARFGSDHFAMYYKVAFPLIDVDLSHPEITEEDREEIIEIIEEGHASARESQ